MALTHVSASQIKDFKACNRLWYYTRILKQRAPQTEAQSRGTTVHGALEAHLKAGAIEPEILERAKALGITEKDLSEYVASMMPFVGKPGEGLTEFRDSMPTFEGGPEYVLVVDHAREIEIKDYGVIPQIDDLKTTSDFRYCKTPDELAKDVQMVSYAKWALWRLYELKNLPQPNFVSLRHVYVRTRGKRLATARDVLVTPEDVEARWQAILGDVRDMVSLSELGAEINPQDVPATTTDHCSAYGGCFFRAQCFGAVYDTSRPFIGLFNKEKKEMIMADGNVLTPEFPANGTGGPRKSLKDRVAERHARGAVAPVAAAAPAVVAAPAPVTAAAPAAASPGPVCGAVHATVFPGYPCTLVPHEGDHESRGPTGGAIHWNHDGSDFGVGASKNWKAITVLTSVPMPVTQAMAATTPAATAAAPTAAAAVAAFSSTVANAATSDVAAVLPPDAASRTSTPEEVAAAGASKRKRATKAEMEARAAGAAAPTAPAAVAVPPAAAPAAPTTLADVATTLATVASACKLEELYIDCMCTKGLAEQIGIGADIIAISAAETAASAKVPDYRFIQYNSKPALATVLRSHLDKIPRVVVISSSVPGADVLIEVLTPHAKRVVQALRG